MSVPPEVDEFFAKAETFLRSARVLLDLPDLDSAVSRAYYAMFFAAEAALLSRNKTAQSHRGMITLFGEEFVRSGILPRERGRQLAIAYDKRQASDYEPTTKIKPENAARFVEEASEFVEAVRKAVRG